MAEFIIISSPDPEIISKSYTISNGDTIGSSISDTIMLKSQDILPQHLKIEKYNDKFKIIGNFNAKFLLNGEEVVQAELSHGDMVMLGEYTLMFNDATPPKIDTKEILKSRIESRQKYYDSTKHIIETLEDSEKSQSRLITLYKISNAISGILDLDHLLKKFLEIIIEEFKADRGFIMLYDNYQRKLVPAAIISKSSQNLEPRVSKSIVDEVFKTKESLLCENIMEDLRFKSQESIISHNIHSAMCVPLIRNGEILGIIHVDSKKRNKFSKSDLDLLTKVALQASIVIENARFYKAKQNFYKNLLALSKATQGISSYLRKDLIIRDATKYASEIFGTYKSFLFLKEDNKLKLVYAIGVDKEKWKNFSPPQVFLDIVEKNHNLIINNKDEILEDLKNIANESLMAVSVYNPSNKIINHLSALGVLCIAERKEKIPFTQEDLQLLTLLGGYTAIALSNAFFYEELKRKEEEIEAWNRELEKRVKERTEELKAVQDKLIQSEKMAAVGLLAAGVSHEFNNIIASMYGFAQIAKKNEKYKDKLIDVVITQSKRACEITESLLSFSKQRGDTIELVDIHELIESVLKLTKTALENEGIKVIKNYGDIPKIWVNTSKIQQVFMNIIINARHAIEKNGTITISTFLSKDKEWVNISFKDTGKGIAPENIRRVFEPFYTTKGSFGGGTQPGTGIGLSLCYNIVKAHGGDITVESELGKGSCFTVILPTKVDKEKTKRINKTPKKIKIKPNSKVLIVEDTESINQLLTHILEEKGFEVHQVMDGSSALELCKKEKFKYIFLDIRMPGVIDGFDVFDEVKKLDPSIKIIFITGRAEDSKLMEYIKYADGYLRKPFDLEDIYRIIDKD